MHARRPTHTPNHMRSSVCIRTSIIRPMHARTNLNRLYIDLIDIPSELAPWLRPKQYLLLLNQPSRYILLVVWVQIQRPWRKIRIFFDEHDNRNRITPARQNVVSERHIVT